MSIHPDFSKIQLPMIRKIIPNIIANEIIGVQPMMWPATHSFKRFITRYDYGSESYTWRDYPLPKARKGKPHWRSLRVLRNDSAYKSQWDALRQAYKEEDKGWYMLDNWWDWVLTKVEGSRKVYDMVYDAYGIHFDNEASRIQFILTWNSSTNEEKA